jgi:glycerol-3-phosphate dehydrogenase
VVNATGPWSDELRKLDDASAEPKLRPAKGAHLILPRRKVGNNDAIVLESRRDGRNMFVLPMDNFCLLGTTDTDYHGNLDKVALSTYDVEYMLETFREYFPNSNVTRNDIISGYAAVRPLAAELGVSEDDVSRDQLIFESDSGLVSIIGGKLTTHRSMAESLVDYVSAKLDHEFSTYALYPCETQHLPLDYGRAELAQAIDNLVRESNVERDVASHLVESYGPSAAKVLEIAQEHGELTSKITPDAPYLLAEARYAARYEMAVKLADFMLRRTQLALRLKDHGWSFARKIANEMAKEMDWPPDMIAKELADFEEACALVEVP